MQRIGSESPLGHRVRIAAFAIIACLAAAPPFLGAAPASAATLDRIKETGKITLGYRTDAQPFSYGDQSGAAAGYSTALCQKIADQVRGELALATLTVVWTPVTLADRFSAVQQGKVDLLCGADTVTLDRRKEVAFSIPIFASGIGALLRADAPAALRQILAEGQPPSHPVWRGSPARTLLEKKTFTIVAGTTGASWLAGRLDAFQISATVAPVDGYDAGIGRVLDRSSDVFFGDRALLLEAARRNASAGNLVVLDRLFTNEPLALALARNDDDFRLVVDKTMSGLLVSKDFDGWYLKWFGEPDESALAFFRTNVLPE
jgi:polar amino acid transport system substrate-binding protein